MRRVIVALMAVLAFFLLAGWMVIAAPFLGELRASLAQHWLDEAGRDVTISGPVNLALGDVIRVTAEDIGLEVAGHSVTAAKLEADISPSDLRGGKIDPRNIVITGASVSLVRDDQGRLVGHSDEGTDGPAANAPPEPKAILAALAGKQVRLVDARVSLRDQLSDFGFDARLATLELRGDPDTGMTTVQGSGTLNGQPLDLVASAAPGASLTATLTSGATSLSFTAADGSQGSTGGWSGQVSAQSTDLSQTLKILKLEPVLDGSAHARATLVQTPDGVLKLAGIGALATLGSGQSARVSGSLGNLRTFEDADIAVDLELYAPGRMPPPALLVKDLRLTSVHLTLIGPLRGDTRRSMVIATNGFQINTSDVGPAPIRFSDISRGQAGQLVISSLSIQIGPVGTPWVTMIGKVGDLLRLDGLSLDGEVDFPVSNVEGPDGKRLPAELGGIAGRFEVSGNVDRLSLTDFSLATQGTDLWSLRASGSVASVLPIDGVNLTMDASAKTAAMLTALGRDSIDLDPLDLHLTVASADTAGTITGRLSARMSKSSVVIDLSANNRGSDPVVKGTIDGTLIRLQDLRDGVLAATEISGAVRAMAPTDAGRKRPDAQPRPDAAQDDVQDITIGLFDKDWLLRHGDVDIAIKFGDVAGESTIRGVDATLVVKDGKASVGPLKFSFDGGHFDLLASIDTIAAPKTVTLKGSGGGWDLGGILKLLHVHVPATGIIDADFDISGSHDSAADFVNTLNGRTTLRMKNGTVASSLLDLAGLGVVPWLFSKDRREKSATITCLRAPLEFRKGMVSTQETVAETPEVQVVVYGTVDLPRRTLDIAGQPRPIGKPLSRSPWPFAVSGSLADPKINLKDGPSRLRRADGSNKMPAERKPCVPDILQLR